MSLYHKRQQPILARMICMLALWQSERLLTSQLSAKALALAMVIFFELSRSSLILLHLDPSGEKDTNIASFQHHRKRKVFPNNKSTR